MTRVHVIHIQLHTQLYGPKIIQYQICSYKHDRNDCKQQPVTNQLHSDQLKMIGFLLVQLLCSTSPLIHIIKSIEPQIITNNGILVSPSIVGTSIFSIIVNISRFPIQAYHSTTHMLFYHFVPKILWHLGLPTQSCLESCIGFHKLC